MTRSRKIWFMQSALEAFTCAGCIVISMLTEKVVVEAIGIFCAVVIAWFSGASFATGEQAP